MSLDIISTLCYTEDAMLGYVAGFVDADGCIRVSPHRSKGASVSFTGDVAVTNTDGKVPYLLKAVFGGTLYQSNQKMENSRPIWRWRVTGAKAAKMVRLIYPHLVRKKLQAENLLDFEDYRQRLHRERMTRPPGQQGYTREEKYDLLTYAMRSKELNAFGRRSHGF